MGRKRGWELHKSRRAWSKTVPRADGGGAAGADMLDVSSFSSSFGFISSVGVGTDVDIDVDIARGAFDKRQQWICPFQDE